MIRQFKALLNKNFLLYRRNWFGSFVEIFFPIMFALIMLVIRKTFPPIVNQGNSLTGYSNFTQTYYPQQFLQPHFTLMKNCKNNLVQQQQVRNGIVALGPAGDPVAQQINRILTNLQYETQMFKSNQQINEITKSSQYGRSQNFPAICFSAFIDSSDKTYKFRLRFNSSEQFFTQGPSTFNPLFGTLKFDYWNTLGTGQISGLFQLNTLILNIIARKQKNTTVSLMPKLSPMGYNTFQNDKLFNTIEDFIDVFTVFPLLILFLRMTSSMLKEKEKRIRQIMKTMGMSQILYYESWILKYFIIYLVTHILVTLIFTLSMSYIDYSLMLVTFILFDLVLIIQSLFIQVFFIKSVMGSLVGLTFFFIQYIGGFIIKSLQLPNETQMITASISPFSSIMMIMQQIFYLNSAAQTLSWQSVTKRVYNYKIIIGLCSLVLNITVWSVLTIYFEQIIPNQQGIKKHPLFLCGYPHDKIETSDLRESINSLNLKRRDSLPTCQGIHIVNLWKKFSRNEKIAVKNLNLQIQSNTIFTLLGHNGAGKTTTLSMLAGITSITQGDILMLGKSIKNDSEQLKKMMGFCPQHNTLYDELTVLEHLNLFNTFKDNNKTSQIEHQRQNHQILTDLQLIQKMNVVPGNLSGGQKRRLQLALSFVGGSKIIFLDQPTSGLDSYSRKRVWNFLRKQRTGKIIILTTHFMDEAEALSDSIGIMKQGKLVCSGLPHTLKQQYNFGYKLNIEKKSSSTPSEPIIQLIKQNFSKQILIQNTVPSELTVQFPVQNLQKLANLLQIIQKKKQQLCIVGYGINTSTLEQVLLHVTKQQEQSTKDLDEIIQTFTTNNQMATKNQLFQDEIQMQYKEQKLDEYPSNILFFKHIFCITKKRFKLTIRSKRYVLLQIIIPLLLVLFVLGVQKIIQNQKQPTYSMNTQLYQGHFPLTFIIASNNTITNVQNVANQIQSRNTNKIKVVTINNTIFQDASIFDKTILIPNKTKQTIAGVLLTNSSIYQILPNTQSVYSALVSLNTISQALINSLLDHKISIQMVYDPLSLTKQETTTNKNQTTSFLIAVIFSIALAFKFSSNINQIVKQRTSSCKHLQIISGMGLVPFWIGNFIFDFGGYLIFTIISLCLCKAFQVNYLISTQPLNASIPLFILFGISQQLFTYVFSFLFEDHSNAQSIFYFLTFSSGSMFPIVVLIFRLIAGVMTKVGLGFSWLFRIVPSYSFGQAIINLSSLKILSRIQYTNFKPLDGTISLYPIIYLSISIPLLLFALVLIELSNWSNLRQICNKTYKVKRQTFKRLDSIVERQIVKTQSANPKDYPILLKNISKIYGSQANQKIAINRLNVSIQKGQVFGLLGVNGAGKSTTFKILTRDITPSSGQVYINGFDINTQFSKARKQIGYCPQFCALFQTLTVKQQLQLYYNIKGFTDNCVKREIFKKLKMLKIKSYQNVYSKDLSGGNQRKLSMGIALLGNPQVVLLDQPSTGVDPYSKRFMWKIINDISSKNKCTVVLTTHSMEEAEYLSTRVGIMVNGNFKCLGSPERVKTKYSDGFFLSIQIKRVDFKQFKIYLQKLQITKETQLSEVNYQNVNEYLDLYFPHNTDKIIEAKKIVNKICSFSSITLRQMLQRMVNEVCGQQLLQFIKNNLSQKIQVQHDNRNWRFKIKQNIPLSTAIILIQKNKNELRILEFHINSVSLEEILNKFSQQYQIEQQMKRMND